MRKIIDPYTKASAPLLSPTILQSLSRILGKKVKTKSPIQIVRNTKKCRALNFSLRAISKDKSRIINPEMIKKSCRSVMF
jgi:hypothetical protein